MPHAGSIAGQDNGQVVDITSKCEPVILDKLRRKIKVKRKRSGQEDITLDTRPPVTYQMTADEREKERKRKEINRHSALRCRKRQREQSTIIYKNLTELTNTHMDLEIRVKKLERQRLIMIGGLKQWLSMEDIESQLAMIGGNPLEGETNLHAELHPLQVGYNTV